MPEEVAPGIHRIGVPLPKNPLREINCYVLLGRGRGLIVDTGMSREECRTALRAGFADLGLDLSRMALLITHLHVDHSGLAGEVAPECAVAYCGQPDADIINRGSDWERAAKVAGANGFPGEELRNALERHPANRYKSVGQVDFEIVRDGTEIEAGDYVFRCIHTPGHTKGHICLYDAHHKLLLSGDHILGTITPNIAAWLSADDMLREYLRSLDRVAELDIELTLPSHRRAITDCRRRIAELKHHHEVRANEALEILRQGPMTAFDVASRMTWDLSYDSFEQFPVQQKWFAAGEALSHLRYLDGLGKVFRLESDGLIRYRLAD